jgi:hypothetical protein
VDITRVHVVATVEVRDHAHVEELYAALAARGMEVIKRTPC